MCPNSIFMSQSCNIAVDYIRLLLIKSPREKFSLHKNSIIFNFLFFSIFWLTGSRITFWMMRKTTVHIWAVGPTAWFLLILSRFWVCSVFTQEKNDKIWYTQKVSVQTKKHLILCVCCGCTDASQCKELLTDGRNDVTLHYIFFNLQLSFSFFVLFKNLHPCVGHWLLHTNTRV